MAALDHVPVDHLAGALARLHQGGEADPPLLRLTVAALAWQAFHRAGTQSVRVRVGPVPVSVRVARLRPLMEALFGPEPARRAGA